MARERTLSEQAFEQFPQALIIVDREATVLSLNPVAQRLTGWALRDAVGRPAADILEVRTETGVNLCAPFGSPPASTPTSPTSSGCAPVTTRCRSPTRSPRSASRPRRRTAR